MEHAICIQRNGDEKFMVEAYVDDLVLTGLDHDDVKSFKEEMTGTFKMSDLDLLHHYIDILLNQGAYAMKILERCGVAGCNPCHVPMETHLNLSKQSTQPPMDARAYWNIVRRLRYLVNTLLGT
jgi:hypothetical protein